MSGVQVTHDGAVTIIQIHRPHKRNAIDGATATALREAWLAFDADETTRVGVLTGGDEVFCAGADLSDLPSLAAEVEGDNGPLGFTRLSVGKPTIAAIAGYCVAGGLELACWCRSANRGRDGDSRLFRTSIRRPPDRWWNYAFASNYWLGAGAGDDPDRARRKRSGSASMGACQ